MVPLKKPDADLLSSVLNKVDKTTDEIKKEIVEIRKDVSTLTTIAAKQQGILDTHIKRTELAEAAIKAATDSAAIDRDNLIKRIVPIEEHVSMWAGAGKVLIILSALAALGGIIYKVLSSASFAL